MKFLIDRDFRGISNPPNWITLSGTELSKDKWKKYGSRSNYLDKVYPSNWRIVYSGKNQILNEENIITLIQRSLEIYYEDSSLLNQFFLDLQTPQNLNSKKKEKKDAIGQLSFDIAVNGCMKFVKAKHKEISKEQIVKYLQNHTEFFFTIPFIDPAQIIYWDNRKQLWELNSVESFLRNNLLIQVKYSLLSTINSVALFLRKDLKLGKGKSGAQLSHALISLLYQPNFRTQALEEFIKQNSKDILIYFVTDLKDLQEIQHMCVQNNINNSLIIDAGHTQIDPGTATCIGVGPLPKVWLEILAFNMEASEIN